MNNDLKLRIEFGTDDERRLALIGMLATMTDGQRAHAFRGLADDLFRHAVPIDGIGERLLRRVYDMHTDSIGGEA